MGLTAANRPAPQSALEQQSALSIAFSLQRCSMMGLAARTERLATDAVPMPSAAFIQLQFKQSGITYTGGKDVTVDGSCRCAAHRAGGNTEYLHRTFGNRELGRDQLIRARSPRRNRRYPPVGGQTAR